jgi:hypothetical protein
MSPPFYRKRHVAQAIGLIFTAIVWPRPALLFTLDAEGPVLPARERVAGRGRVMKILFLGMNRARGAV